jgi:hypothetical protein
MLRYSQASPSALFARVETKLQDEVLEQKGASARCGERDGSTPPLLAANAGNRKAIKHLMKRLGKDDPDKRNIH